jgi:hypothetical protein
MKSNISNPKNDKTPKKKLRIKIGENRERVARLDKAALAEEARIRFEGVSPKKWSGIAKSYRSAKLKEGELLRKLSPELEHLSRQEGETIHLELAKFLLKRSLLREITQDEWDGRPSEDPDFYNSIQVIPQDQVEMDPQFKAAL